MKKLNLISMILLTTLTGCGGGGSDNSGGSTPTSNSAPTILSAEGFKTDIAFGEQLRFNISVNDKEGDDTSFKVINSNSNLSITRVNVSKNEYQLVVYLKDLPSNDVTYNFKVTSKDTKDASSEKTFSLRFVKGEAPPSSMSVISKRGLTNFNSVSHDDLYTYWLDASNNKLTSLSGLENAYSGMIGLDLNTNETLSDISIVSRFKDLTYLDLQHAKSLNYFCDVGSLPNLTYLNISHINNKDSHNDSNCLSNLTKMDTLLLNGSNGYSLDFASNMPKLKNIYSRDTNLKNISGLNNLTHLEVVDLGKNPIDTRYDDNRLDIDSLLNSASSLKELSVDGSTTTNLYSLENMSNMERLNLNKIGLGGISFVSNMDKLKVLNISENNVADLGSLSGKNLTELVANDNYNLHSISDLTNMTSLELLVLTNNPICDYSPIGDFTNLKHLDLEYTVDRDHCIKYNNNNDRYSVPVPITVFDRLNHLTYLNLDHALLNSYDFGFVKNMPNLTKLNIRNTIRSESSYRNENILNYFNANNWDELNLIGIAPVDIRNFANLKMKAGGRLLITNPNWVDDHNRSMEYAVDNDSSLTSSEKEAEKERLRLHLIKPSRFDPQYKTFCDGVSLGTFVVKDQHGTRLNVNNLCS